MSLPEPSASEGIARLFVTVGTDYHRFDRLIRWLDEWLATAGDSVGHVVVQRGTSADSSGADLSVDYLQRGRLVDEFQRASVVVCHGGPATILECRSNGIVPIVVPRELRYGEHVNDHQVDFCLRLAAHEDIQLARSREEFFGLLDRAVERGSPEVAVDDGHTAESLRNFELAMIDLLGERARSLTRRLSSAPKPPTDDRIPVLFIGSVPRSGSTLVGDLLNEHPHMLNLGEVVHLWQRGLIDNDRCACGEPFSDCSFWRKVGDRAFGGWDKISGPRMQVLKHRADRTRFIPALMSPRPVPVVATSIRQYGGVVERILNAAREISGARVLVDTSKHVSTALVYRQMSAVDLRVVHLVRDPRGVAHSWGKHVPRPEVTGPSHGEMVRLHPGRVGLRWLWFNLAFSSMGRFGVPVGTFRYEDVVADPVGMVDQMFRLAGVEPLGDELFGGSSLRLAETGHSVAGNPRRFDRGPVELRLDESWRTELGRGDTSLVSWVSRPLRGRYGYTGAR